ncbi:MAG: tRNA (guanosine(46)-N7)-methyltransferase TrmB [Clostridia bacterium]|nr:tRNA (guanosine(46)-N7)-methyltransferase TrmB [Clostridia bacterium]
MHIRKKKWARPELEACPFYEPAGEWRRGRWREAFARPERPLQLEMGCGKGVSTAQMVAANPEINYVVVDISPDVLGDTRRNLVRACGETPENVFILLADICLIDHYFDREDGPERIHISFCNPWTERPKHEKRRLTHPRQLIQYRKMLQPGGEIWFKTDDDSLYADSLVYFDLCGFEPVFQTGDLRASGFQPNYVSEHEQKYMALGVPIKFGIFRMTDREPSFDPTRFRMTPGLRRLAVLPDLGGKPDASVENSGDFREIPAC